MPTDAVIERRARLAVAVNAGLALVFTAAAYWYGLANGFDRIIPDAIEYHNRALAAAITDLAYGVDLGGAASAKVLDTLQRNGVTVFEDRLSAIGVKFPANLFDADLLNAARGDAAICYDCDLQDPPDLLPVFVKKWREGYDVVYGIRRKRNEGWAVSCARRIFYRFLALISETDVPVDVGDFRLVSRRILDELKDVEDQTLYLRGTIASMGFKQIGIAYDRQERQRGKTKFPLRRLVSLAIDGVLSQSVVPLRIATFVGCGIFVVTFAMALFYLISALFLGEDWPRGFATTTLLILFGISINSLFLGIIGEYVGRTFSQSRRRTKVIVEAAIDS